MWSELGHAQLKDGLVDDAIASYLRAGDSSKYLQVRILRDGALLSRCVGVTGGIQLKDSLVGPAIPSYLGAGDSSNTYWCACGGIVGGA